MPRAKNPPKRKRGGQPGNKNASGATKRNKLALITGEHEYFFMDCLTDEEKALVDQIDLDKIRILREELIVLTLRERRMLKRIEDLQNSPKGMAIERIVSREIAHRRKNGEIVTTQTETTKELETALNRIQRIEEALTRVQIRRQTVADLLHKMETDADRRVIAHSGEISNPFKWLTKEELKRLANQDEKADT